MKGYISINDVSTILEVDIRILFSKMMHFYSLLKTKSGKGLFEPMYVNQILYWIILFSFSFL